MQLTGEGMLDHVFLGTNLLEKDKMPSCQIVPLHQEVPQYLQTLSDHLPVMCLIARSQM